MDYLLLWVICAIVAAAIGSSKNEAGSAFVLGLIFGPLAIVFALMSSGGRKKCPFCAEMIRKEAKVCPRCQRDLVSKTAVV